jgi:hypothetical protein
LDTDYWQDWTSWMIEIEVGIALLLSSVRIGEIREIGVIRVMGGIGLLAFPLLLTVGIYYRLGSPDLLNAELPSGLEGLTKLEQLVGDSQRVFLSGTPVFWSNLNQVRGGRDEIAQNPIWGMAAYQIREGADEKLTRDWLKVLGVSYVLVHSDSSPEFYHDFENLPKWEKVGQVIWGQGGDTIYNIEGNSLAWSVDNTKIIAVRKPISGTDQVTLSAYLSTFQQPLIVKKTVIGWEIDAKGSQTVLVLNSYSDHMQAFSSSGELLNISSDNFGMTVIDSRGAKQVIIIR